MNCKVIKSKKGIMDMQKERIIIFPYSREFAAFVRYIELNEEYEIVSLISPIGWGLNCKDASIVDRGENIGININSDFKSMIKKCDTVVIAKCELDDEEYKEKIFKNIIIAIKNRKNIINTIIFDKSRIDYLCKLAKENDVYFRNISLKQNRNNKILSKLKPILKPIIVICGISEYTNKFYIQLSLRKAFLDDGYNVSTIGSKSYCELLGFNSFPEFMMSSNIHEDDKVIKFNDFIHNISIKENPDIIILGIPGEIMQLGGEANSRFGILAYEVFNSINPDYTIVSLLYNENTQYEFSEINNIMKYRLNTEVDAFNMSNYRLDWLRTNESVGSGQVFYDNYNSNLVDKEIGNSYNKIYNILNDKSSKKLYKDIIQKLSNDSNNKVINEEVNVSV